MFKFWLYLFWFSTYFELNVEREKKVAKQYIKEEIFSRSTFNSIYRKTSPTTRTSSNPRTRQQRAGQTVFFIEERAPVKSAHPSSPRTTKPSKTRNLCELQ